MGLDVNGTRFILYAWERGVDLADTLTVGRQHMLLGAVDLAGNFVEFGHRCDPAKGKMILESSDGFADAFLRSLGAKTVESMDASGYEGATLLHDLNLPVGEEHKNRFSAVIDGGSLEHVFNFPQALKNCMEMVRPGGHFLAITPANNFFGHGFYQFSPELFFRIFTSANGYEIVDLFAFEDRPRAPWYAVTDPVSAGQRVVLVNRRPVYLLVIAKRIAVLEPLVTAPQQSDYVTSWERQPDQEPGRDKGDGSADADGSFVKQVLRWAPYPVKRIARWGLTGSDPEMFGFDQEWFTEVSPAGIVKERGRELVLPDE